MKINVYNYILNIIYYNYIYIYIYRVLLYMKRNSTIYRSNALYLLFYYVIDIIITMISMTNTRRSTSIYRSVGHILR